MNGLTETQAKSLLREHGFNELPVSQSKNLFRIVAEVIREPMFLLLIACGTLYILLGDYREGVVLLLTILIIIFITFYQYQKTEKALEALKNLSAPRALVRRDGKEVRIPGREVVPGDLLILHEGDRIAADARLEECIHLSVDESMLTGESVPVFKTVPSNTETAEEMVYSGTLVVRGSGYARVLKTGLNTRFGLIGASLERIESSETRLQAEMKKLIRNLFLIGFFISLCVILAFYLTRGQFVQALLNGLAAAMAILPEEFPVVLTVFLALGAWRLSKKNVLTRKPSTIETLGSATVLCTDKTGTLTRNQMELAALFTGDHLYTKNTFKENQQQSAPLLYTAYLASEQGSIDPMETAIYQVYRKLDVPSSGDLQYLKTFPLRPDLLAMTRIYSREKNQDYLACCKGAPEAVFALCRLKDVQLNTLNEVVRSLARDGYRILAVAQAEGSAAVVPDDVREIPFILKGLLAFEDPVRPEVPEAIRECKAAGIKVIMITGDYPETARSIATQIGLPAEHIITGAMLDEMNEATFRDRIKNVNIFARVIPEQKLRIVEALKDNQEIVAMTGDGVNDAPALKSAHIGVAMGGKGTDVAREASALVLLDDNFASIVAAVRSGRKIYDNLQKAMTYIMAIHIPIIGLTLLPAFFESLPLILMPLHIVFMELIIDPVCSVVFEAEGEERGIMNRPPRPVAEKFFGRRKILLSVFEGLLLLCMVLAVHIHSRYGGHSEPEIRAIAFTSLILGNLFLILSSLSHTRSFIRVATTGTLLIPLIFTIAVALLWSMITLPVFQVVFGFANPGWEHFLPAVAGAGILLVVLETLKFIRIRSGYGVDHSR